MPNGKSRYFDWDGGNEGKNVEKHNVTNGESEEAFRDEHAVYFDDLKHSYQEKRYVLIGKTKRGRVLCIAFTILKSKYRVISSRDANRKEVLIYEEKVNSTRI